MAQVNNKIVGAVWVRIMNDYGHIDDEASSLGISLYKEYREFGIGTALMKEILALLKDYDYGTRENGQKKYICSSPQYRVNPAIVLLSVVPRLLFQHSL